MYDMGLCFPRTAPQVFAHKGTTDHFFHLWENQQFEQNFFKTPMCLKGAHTGPVF